MNIRALAAEVVGDILNHHGSLKACLPEALDRCPANERPLLTQLCYGVMRDYHTLNVIAAQLFNRPIKPRDYDIRALVLIGLYQLRELRIPEHAILNETVEATYQLDKEWARKLVNAVLRRYTRERDSLDACIEKSEPATYKHPDWMIQKLKGNWPDHWQSILEGNNHQGPLTLRINTALVSRETYLAQLAEAGLEAESTEHSPQGIRLAQSTLIPELPGYNEGWFSVQDEAAQLAGQLLPVPANGRVLDACAAPGGKLTHLLELHPTAEVTAIELEPRRMAKVEENLERLGLNAGLIVGDASSNDWWDQKPFDSILVDAPCSAVGVIRRNPDIKYLRKNEDIGQLANTQLAVLNNLWGMLAPGGTLVYATCSVFTQENERLIARFLKQDNIDAEHQSIDAAWGLERDYGRQLFPQTQSHDGFYYAVLKKPTRR
ncbi:MAG: 16S rRNA (cytosine(967)-C(5))-methyltransferase RsmB [Pontibacterium sp.]